MAAIDRLGWAAGVSVTSFGVRVGVRVDDPALLPTLLDHLPPGWQESSATVVDRLYSMRVGGTVAGTRIRRFHVGYSGGRQFLRSLDPDEAWALFEAEVQFDVAVASDLVFVHAGAVGWRGRAILIPAPSMAGKSRLVRALVDAGATYYSDEFAILDSRGRVVPFARPLTLRTDAGRLSKVVWPAAGRAAASKPLPIGCVVATRYEAGSHWRPREGGPAAALM